MPEPWNESLLYGTNEPIRDESCPAVKSLVEQVIENHSTKAHYRKLRWDRSIGFNINDDETHKIMNVVRPATSVRRRGR